MISSTSSPDRTPQAHPATIGAAGTARPFTRHQDRISTGSVAFLRAALQRQPEIRPEVVARARALAADPNYPSAAVIKNVAKQILAAADLSEDQS